MHKNKMFGKYQKKIPVAIESGELYKLIEEWSDDNKLKLVKRSEESRKYRYGSPYLSNPIYIEIQIYPENIVIIGWVQTLIPFLTWKIVNIKNNKITTKLDYRRKGGYFCHQLESKISQIIAENS